MEKKGKKKRIKNKIRGKSEFYKTYLPAIGPFLDLFSGTPTE